MARLIQFAVVALVGLEWTGSAPSQEWPIRPLTMIVPFAAGGPADTVGRILAPRLSELLGQQVVVENVGGSGGMTGIVGCTSSTNGERVRPATIAMSRIKLKLRLG